MLYKNLTAKELYASIYATSIVEEMFVIGLKIGSTQLAISAMEELIVRGDTDIIRRGLDSAFKEGHVKIGTSMSTMIARSLSESCREADPSLQRFGKFLFKAKTNDPFNEFVNDSGVKFCSGGDELSGRFSKYFTLESPMGPETTISTGSTAQEPKWVKEYLQLQKPSDDSLLKRIKEALSDSGVDRSAIKWLFELTPGQFAGLRKVETAKALSDSGVDQSAIKWLFELTPGQFTRLKKDVMGILANP